MSSEELQQAEIDCQGPGQILKQARENCNLSTQDIADKIKLKRSLIENIEQDNYDINISLTFIKGYLKLYAKHVDVPEAKVMAAFDTIHTQDKEPAKLQSFSRRLAKQANDDKLMLVTYFIVVVVIALVVIWWWQQSKVEVNQVAANQGISQPLETESENLTAASPSSQDKPQQVEQQTSELNSQITGDNAPDAVPMATPDQANTESQLFAQQPEAAMAIEDEPAQQDISVNEAEATLPSPPDGTVSLVFEFSGDCWMNLVDATGEKIAYGVKVKGRVMPVSGVPPFEVTLGAPEFVQISYQGQALDMSFLTPGRIAKFSLPLSE